MPHAIGVDVGGTGTKGGIVQSDGEVVARVDRPTDPHSGTKGIIAVVEELLERSSDLGTPIDAIGVGAAGFINAATGSVIFAPNLTYDDPNIAEALRTRTGLQVIVDNDANAAAWGERTYGTARGSDHLACVTIGTGIGSGFVTEGRLLRGFTGAGAEFGHTVIDPEGPRCPCGLRGCLEQFASGTAIARMARAAVAEDPSSSIASFAEAEEITAVHVARAAREYDDVAREVLRKAGRSLGIGLSNIANVFDPEVIVLTGSVLEAGEPYLGPARDALAGFTTSQKRRPMRLDVSSLGEDAGLIGAAALAFVEAK